jgi:pimeloyl-ACP methyl ester carboxylesterase
MAHIILVPGLWLDATSWEAVVPLLQDAGHTARPLTLPGLESRDADRSAVSLQDQVDAVVRAIDAVPEDQGCVVVGHSLGAGIVHLAVDARPERVVRAIYVGGFPCESGSPLAQGFTTEGADLPLPELAGFDDRDIADLDDTARTDFVARAIPSPASLTTDVAQLSDDRRLAVPVTMVCPEFSSEELREWVDGGDLPELARLTDVTYVDIESGHWPQLTRPAELAAIIDGAASAR